MFSVVTNNNALAALQSLNNTQRALSMTQNRITTGLSVAGAADNASTFTIAQGMRGDIAGLKSAAQSISLGKSTVGVALSAATQISDKLNELKQKVTDGQAQNVDLAKIQQDMDSIVQSISDIGNAAQFNGVNLLNGSLGAGLDVLTGLNRTSAIAETIASTNISAQDLDTTTLAINALDVTTSGKATFTPGALLAVADGNTITLTAGGIAHTFEFTDGTAALTTNETAVIDAHAVLFVAADTTQQRLAKSFDVMRDAGFTVNTNEDGSFEISHQTLTATASTVTALTANPVVSTSAAAFDAVNTAITTVNAAVAALGTSSNSLDSSAKFVSSLTTALTEGVGNLVDADMAEESANLQALQTRQQLGIQALSIANQGPSAIMALFRG